MPFSIIPFPKELRVASWHCLSFYLQTQLGEWGAEILFSMLPDRTNGGKTPVGFAWGARLGIEARFQVLPHQPYWLVSLKYWWICGVIPKVINNRKAGLVFETTKMLVGKKAPELTFNKYTNESWHIQEASHKHCCVLPTMVQKTNNISIPCFMKLKVTVKTHNYLSLPPRKKNSATGTLTHCFLNINCRTYIDFRDVKRWGKCVLD